MAPSLRLRVAPGYDFSNWRGYDQFRLLMDAVPVRNQIVNFADLCDDRAALTLTFALMRADAIPFAFISL